MASCLHHRVGAGAIPDDLDVVADIGRRLVARCLVAREDAVALLAAEQRARALRGASILRGTVVRFVDGEQGVYVGGEDRRFEPGYTFRFGAGTDARLECMHLALMGPGEWRVYPYAAEGATAVASGVPPAPGAGQ